MTQILIQSLIPIFVGLLFGASDGAKSEVASWSLILSTALSILTLPVWIVLLDAAAIPG